ncbi:MAG: GntR family transcriptional regulator [Flavobacteriaceae bacterium]|nr:GntR family transcriptional regulator [Mangrovimonas sp.]MCB0469372.1 GntR family transcriptional regulator [Flavobacteriaceae bacterium]
MSLISVDAHLGAPKYRQIVTSVEEGLMNGLLKKGDKLPSINSIRDKFSLSRDTVLMAFSELKARGIVESVSGKGYYIKSDNIKIKQKIFVLFDELNAFKEDLYNSFLENLQEDIQVDIFFHHFSFEVFSKHIYDSVGNYNHYVIMPANLPHTNTVIEKLPNEKVFILDQTHEELKHYPSIHQNFQNDIYKSLKQALPRLGKYDKLVLLFPDSKQPLGMLNGFQKFRKETQFNHEVIKTLEGRNLQKGEAYLILDDRDLIVLIKKIKETNLEIGKDIGVISYNDTLLKEIVEGGITTISTDFKLMGKRLAEMIAKNERFQIENPNALIVRNSL